MEILTNCAKKLDRLHCTAGIELVKIPEIYAFNKKKSQSFDWDFDL